MQIAIDGPVCSGKGTLAASLARKLHTIHVYTGGMYRALAYHCLSNNIDIHSEDEVIEALKQINIGLEVGEGAETRVLLNGNDITDEVFFLK